MTPYFDVRYTVQGTRITIVESTKFTRKIDRLLPRYMSFHELKTVFFEMLGKIDLNYAHKHWCKSVESRRFKSYSASIDMAECEAITYMVQQLYYAQTNEQCSYLLTNNTSPYICFTVDYENCGLWTLTRARAAELVDNYLIDTVTDPRSAVQSVLTTLIYHMPSLIYSFFFHDYVLYDAAVNAGGITNGWISLMQRTTTKDFVRNLSFKGELEEEKERKRHVYKRCWDLVLQKRWGEV